MPDYVMNQIHCTKSVMIELLNESTGDMDFNRIIPRPRELEVEDGSIVSPAIAYYLACNYDYVSHLLSDEQIVKMLSSMPLHMYINRDYDTNKLYTLGEQYVYNYINYGYFTWYKWSINNWGTKWNACDTIVDCDEDGYETIQFLTAWSEPMPIYTKICELFPDEDIEFIAENEQGMITTFRNENGKLVTISNEVR